VRGFWWAPVVLAAPSAFCFWWALACGSRGFYFVKLSGGGVCQNGPFPGGADWQSSPPFGGTNSDTYHQHDVHMRVQRAPPSVIGD